MDGNKSYSVLIVDDHSIIRDGIKAMLSDCDEIAEIDEVESAEKCIKKLESRNYNVILLDISMNGINGLDATAVITKQHRAANILILTMHQEEEYFKKAVESGAKGYILKNSNRDELIEAIRHVANQKNFFSNEVYSSLIKMRNSVEPSPPNDESKLTKRERVILRLIAEEMTNHEIAEELFISPRTVDTHRRNLLQKLKVKNTAGLVKYAVLNGILHT